MIDLFFGFDLRQVHIPGFYVAGHYSRRGFEIEPHELAGEHEGKWALTLTRLSEFTNRLFTVGRFLTASKTRCVTVSSGSHHAAAGVRKAVLKRVLRG
jgi:hypothetical protein